MLVLTLIRFCGQFQTTLLFTEHLLDILVELGSLGKGVRGLKNKVLVINYYMSHFHRDSVSQYHHVQ